jgi:hypothetical protein
VNQHATTSAADEQTEESIDAAPDAPHASGPDDASRLLLRFVHERDVDCPRCGYNLRNLTKPVCPECDEPLSLKVSVEPIRLVWLLATLAPGFFSGIAAAILLIPIFAFGPPPPEIVITVVFGMVSGVITLAVALASHKFIRQPVGMQASWATVTWMVHLVAFGIFIASLP